MDIETVASANGSPRILLALIRPISARLGSGFWIEPEYMDTIKNEADERVQLDVLPGAFDVYCGERRRTEAAVVGTRQMCRSRLDCVYNGCRTSRSNDGSANNTASHQNPVVSRKTTGTIAPRSEVR